MTATDFSVDGMRVLVVGAARSGVAAARLLARRGAVTTLTDRKAAIPPRAGPPRLPENEPFAAAQALPPAGRHPAGAPR